MRYFGIIPAAGIGTRMQSATPKQYLKINGRMILEITLAKFASIQVLSEIVVPIHQNDMIFSNLSIPKSPKITPILGGINRRDSVLNALNYLKPKVDENDWILVHDAARPLVELSDINNLIRLLKDDAVGGILADQIYDTLKESEDNLSGDLNNKLIKKTINRANIWRAFTPQMFRFRLLYQALENCPTATDESQAIEQLGYQAHLIKSSANNIKITTPNDLNYAKWLLTTSLVD